MSIAFHALQTATAKAIRASGRDAYGNPVETHTSDGAVYPCRHCLGAVPEGMDYLILAHRPFGSTNPYAETGPIFLCAENCARAETSGEVPSVLRSPAYIVRAYDAAERIIYGTGKVTPTPEIPDYAETLLADPRVAFIDIRSAANNCYQCRITRA